MLNRTEEKRGWEVTDRTTRQWRCVWTGKAGSIARRVSLALVLAVLVPARAVIAVEEYQVSELRWNHHGAYLARAKLKWKSQKDGEIHKAADGCTVPDPQDASDPSIAQVGQHVTCVLSDFPKWMTLAPGDEVWMHIDIIGGENKSCRKDDVRLIYDPNSALQGQYSSGGTTFNNNRCKWRGVQPLW